MGSTKVHDLIIVGAGPTALSAALYACREDIETLLFEKGIVGGLAATTDWVDNYPGFPDGVSGDDLADRLRKQAERFGAKFEFAEVSDISRSGDIIALTTDSGEYHARSVLIATGTNHKKLHVPGEKEFHSRGVHYCATCDGAFYREKRVIVVGGGNSAVQEALFLTRFVSHIDLLVRSELRASEVLQHRLAAESKITVHTNVSIDEILSRNDQVSGVRVTNHQTGAQRDIVGEGVFIFIGLLPNTAFLKHTAIELDQGNFILADNDHHTNVQGIFVAGDVRSGSTMQIANAVGEGAAAALAIRNYLEHAPHDKERI